MKQGWKWTVTGTIISWVLGYIGADRMYKGEVGLGIVKLVTFGGLGVWWLVDAFMWTYELGKIDR